MTPAVKSAKQRGVAYKIHEYAHDPANRSYGLEAAEKLGLPPERIFKTLVVAQDNSRLAVGVIPVSQQLNLKRLAKVLGCKKLAMAERRVVERSTGYILGGVSPLGQKKPLETVLDESARAFETIFVSAGRRGLEIELNPQDLVSLTRGRFAEIC